MIIHRFPVITSTNDEAIRRAKEGGDEGEVFIADRQTAGRGRMGRTWESPGEKNLYLSILLRPSLAPDKMAPITLVAGAAVRETLVSLITDKEGEQLKIKPPNDVYWGNKKIAGILAESSVRGGSVAWVVCGIGINLNADLSTFSPDLRQTATSFKIATDRVVDRDEVAVRLVDVFNKRYSEFCLKGPGETVAYCNRYSYEADT